MLHAEQTDLRIRRTHRFLQEAMIELITEKGFDTITVGDIAERAMINRATFYRHYQDKYNLVTKIFEETTNHLVERMKSLPKDAIHLDRQDPPEIWVEIFEHVAEQRQLYRAMLGKNGSPWFVAMMREHIIKLILENERRWTQSGESERQTDPAMPNALPVMLLAHLLIGAIAWWLENAKNYTPRQIATWFCHFAFYGYLSARGYEGPLPGKG